MTPSRLGPLDLAQRLLTSLVEAYLDPADLMARREGASEQDLSVRAGLIAPEQLQEPAALAGVRWEVREALAYLETQGWITALRVSGTWLNIKPTPAGIDEAWRRAAPWYGRLWRGLRGEGRSLVLSVLVSAVTSLVVSLLVVQCTTR